MQGTHRHGVRQVAIGGRMGIMVFFKLLRYENMKM